MTASVFEAKTNEFLNKLDCLTIERDDININYRNLVTRVSSGIFVMTGEYQIIQDAFDSTFHS